MELIVAVTLMLTLAAATALANRFLLPRKVCPVCAGVSGTWFLLSAGMIAGLLPQTYLMLVAVLMGGSVVGIAHQLEKKFDFGARAPLVKLGVILAGSAFTYAAVSYPSLLFLVLEALILAILTYLLFLSDWKERDGAVSSAGDEKISKLEEEMEKCC